MYFAAPLESSVFTGTIVGPNLLKLPSEGISGVHLLGIKLERNVSICKQAKHFVAFPVLSASC